ncbi:MAG: CRISPR system precrRNA processing endoribonuclease RAMP protein Cas6 [Firmicutes bacterium]|nr:CRISPR system precrRNA processing endoribonuclease RAMP protein Cas6 [Bacillota bacterium]
MFSELRVATYRLKLVLEQGAYLPFYKGSTFRGGFGSVFRQMVCSQGRLNCQECLLNDRCPYSYIFETTVPEDSPVLRNQEEIPRPYIIEPSLDGRTYYAAGEELTFHLILIGQAIEFLPYFLVTFRELGKQGIGRAANDDFPQVGKLARPLSESTGELSRRPWLPGPTADSSFVTSSSSGTLQLVDDGSVARPAYSHAAGFSGGTLHQGEARQGPLRRSSISAREPDFREERRRRESGQPLERGRRATFILAEVRAVEHPDQADDGSLLYAASEGKIYNKRNLILTGDEIAQKASSLNDQMATLDFVTMTRLKHGDRLTDKPDFHVLVRSLLRRISSLARFHHGIPLEVDFTGLIRQAERVWLVRNDTRWEDWERFSSRQDTRMKLGGIVGTATYEGDLAPFRELLITGQWTHAGKNVTFGLGKYRVRG